MKEEDRYKIDPHKWEKEHKTQNGGFTKADLESIGVKWPPKKGWLKEWKSAYLSAQ